MSAQATQLLARVVHPLHSDEQAFVSSTATQASETNKNPEAQDKHVEEAEQSLHPALHGVQTSEAS